MSIVDAWSFDLYGGTHTSSQPCMDVLNPPLVL
ncbi:UNVERIFIED_CONTAM: hypothetical protein DES50_101233 [Williamsia faeni]